MVMLIDLGHANWAFRYGVTFAHENKWLREIGYL
jgi:hypothetical protein